MKKRMLAAFLALGMAAALVPVPALGTEAYFCQKEAHVHGDACYGPLQICIRAEHTHGESCQDNPDCQIPEHTHDAESCYRNDITATLCELEAHTHEDACRIDPNGQSEPEAPEVPQRVQAFLDAVAAIVIPEELNDETGPVLNSQIGEAGAAYDLLEAEDYSREDVQAALETLEKARTALTGGEMPADGPTAENHTCSGIAFTPWTAADALPDQPGNYYLTQKVEVAGDPSWAVPQGTVNLCLHGMELNFTGEKVNRSAVGISIGSGSILNLYDCQGGYIHTTTYLNPKDGIEVTGGTFVMNGGTLKDCDKNGSGINLRSGSIILNGGTIANNNHGIGVYGGTLTMNGGTITGNKHGIALLGGTLTMNGGQITANSNSGVMKGDNTTATFSGSSQVDKILTRESIRLENLTAGASFGITANTEEEFLLASGNAQELMQYLHSASNSSVLLPKDDGIWVHKHTLQYERARVNTEFCPSGSYDTIVETCTGCDHRATLTMTAQNIRYDGNNHPPVLKADGNYAGSRRYNTHVPGGMDTNCRNAGRYTVNYKFVDYDFELTVRFSIYKDLGYGPMQPTAETVTATTIKVSEGKHENGNIAPAGVSYALSENSNAKEAELTWQHENRTFTGLKPNTTYYAFVRFDAFDGGIMSTTPTAAAVSVASEAITTLDAVLPTLTIEKVDSDYPQLKAKISESTGELANPTYQWYIAGQGALSGATGTSLDTTVSKAGQYTVYCIATVTVGDAWETVKSNEVTVDLAPRSVSWGLVSSRLVWDGDFTPPAANQVTMTGVQQGDEVYLTLTPVTIPTGPDTYVIKAVLAGADKDKYVLSNERVSLTYVAPFALNSSFASAKTYDRKPFALPGESDLNLAEGVQMADLSLTWQAGAGSALTQGQPVNAGSYTLTIAYRNYSVTHDVTIGKGEAQAVPVHKTVRYTDTSPQQVNLAPLLTAYAGTMEYGTPTWSHNKLQTAEVDENGVLTFQLSEGLAATEIPEIYIKVTGLTNYEYANITLTVQLTEKDMQAPLTIQGIPETVVYGDSFPIQVQGGSGNGGVSVEHLDSGLEVTPTGNPGEFQVTVREARDLTLRMQKEGDETYEKAITDPVIIQAGKRPIKVKARDVTCQVGKVPTAFYLESVTNILPDDGAPGGTLTAPTADGNQTGVYDIQVALEQAWLNAYGDRYTVTLVPGKLTVVEHLYRITRGAGQTVLLGNSARFTASMPFAVYSATYVDGTQVAAEDLTTAPGSTIVTLKADFVKALGVGTHSLRVEAQDGDAVTTFTVAAEAAGTAGTSGYDTDSPQTGDTTGNSLWLLLMVLGLAGLVSVQVIKKRSKGRR